MSQVLNEIARLPREESTPPAELRLQLMEHGGRPFVSLALWVADAQGELQPSRSFALRLEELGWLRSALDSPELADGIRGTRAVLAITQKPAKQRSSPKKPPRAPYKNPIRADGTIADEDVFG